MDISRLGKPYPIRFTYNQNRAFEMLNLGSYNKTAFIRLAVEEKLKRDFRKMLAKVNKVDCPF